MYQYPGNYPSEGNQIPTTTQKSTHSPVWRTAHTLPSYFMSEPSNDILAMNTKPSTQILVCKLHSLLKGLHGEMAGSRARAEQVPDQSEISCWARRQGSA